MTIPSGEVRVPARVRALARGAALTPVWENGIGGLTFRTDDGRYLKHGPRHAETTLRDEAERMRWASAWTPVPHVLAQGEDDAEEWLVSVSLPGRSAVDARWIARPEIAVPAVGRALRALHDALPVAECPWSWGVPERIDAAARRGVVVPQRLHEPPPIDRLVVCHGDACVPNTLLSDDGAWLAHVDLGALGTADRWADIAVASMSTTWNFGPGYEDLLIEAYGVRPDRARIAYYRALWDAT
ncbi:aminoglycoside 3'-phosphotransferase [uncultured Microbacterium sp.]|uniref:aminoglycoside 3'-phosphotransferase n=1 Tax=uncultured Microbacterium sp. TaxID=191216 RepID=UPI0025DBA856|nr:aminoglycoside 3'-phosphotransferase [uncultured Microbacterium sp.]